jgi:hypothetical protein
MQCAGVRPARTPRYAGIGSKCAVKWRRNGAS